MLVASICIIACNNKHTPTVRAFYYWKTDFNLSNIEQQRLQQLHVKKLYVRFFDVSYNPVKGAVPLATLSGSLNMYPSHPHYDTVITEQTPIPDSLYREIVPTVFITNYTFEKLKPADIPKLAQNVSDKLKRIIEENRHPNHPKTFREIQFDCDWNQKTRDKFFLFLKEFRKQNPQFKLSATIRLYQYKYFSKAGVPPVDKGMLMPYNLTSLREPKVQNSILDVSEVRKYLTHKEYPLPLDFAIPVFSWGVIFRDNRYTAIYQDLSLQKAQQLTFLKPTEKNLFQVTADTVFANEYLREGDVIKVEDVSEKDLLELADALQSVRKKDSLTVSFFHLDEEILKKYPKRQIFETVYQEF